jgi:hypothetical protein
MNSMVKLKWILDQNDVRTGTALIFLRHELFSDCYTQVSKILKIIESKEFVN